MLFVWELKVVNPKRGEMSDVLNVDILGKQNKGDISVVQNAKDILVVLRNEEVINIFTIRIIHG